MSLGHIPTLRIANDAPDRAIRLCSQAEPPRCCYHFTPWTFQMSPVAIFVLCDRGRMAHKDDRRASMIRAFEDGAELLVAHHLDLLAQIEAQLRAVHHTMRRIERLRGAKMRVGAELSNGERRTVLGGLTEEIAALDAQLDEEHQCCVQMQDTIDAMQQRLRDLKQVAAQIETTSES